MTDANNEPGISMIVGVTRFCIFTSLIASFLVSSASMAQIAGNGGSGGNASVQVIIIPQGGAGGRGGNAYGGGNQNSNRQSDTAFCTVEDPSPTPLNVRNEPYGQILGALRNGALVKPIAMKRDSRGSFWSLVVPAGSGQRGWVFRKYIVCRGD